MLSRHGQYLRWRKGRKCPCVTTNNRPDLHCKKCGGQTGIIYDYQREYEDVFRETVRENIITIPEEYTGAEIIEIYDSYGRKYKFSQYDNFIQIEDAKIQDNVYVDVRVRAKTVKRLEEVELIKVGGGYYRVPGIEVEPSKFEGVYYQATGDVLSVESIEVVEDEEYTDEEMEKRFNDDDFDDADIEDADEELEDNENEETEPEEEIEPVKILGFRRDMIYTDSDADTLIAHGVEYILPFRFIILSQNLTKSDSKLVDAHNGDAVCTHPYMYDLSENDVLTVLSGTQTHKITMEKTEGEDDTIPEFFVASVESIETKTATYKENEDFVIIGTNQIHWIGNQPEATEMMSITYKYNPTYRVIQDIPMLRTSEDQRMPRKVTLKLYSAFEEAAGVNRND